MQFPLIPGLQQNDYGKKCLIFRRQHLIRSEIILLNSLGLGRLPPLVAQLPAAETFRLCSDLL
jgi:hypothetical protein